MESGEKKKKTKKISLNARQKRNPGFIKTIEKTGDKWPKQGNHLVRYVDVGIQMVNRKTSRGRNVNRSYTAKNFKYLKENEGFHHTYNAKKDPKSPQFVHPNPSYPPRLSNNTRHRERQIARQIREKQNEE